MVHLPKELRLLASNGARDFAVSAHIEVVDPQTMISDRASEEWRRWSQMHRDQSMPVPHGSRSSILQDTVGCVIQDHTGKMSAGASR